MDEIEYICGVCQEISRGAPGAQTTCRCGAKAYPQRGLAGGLKFDAEKPRMDLLIDGMPRALQAVGDVLTFGAKKYAAHSWRDVEDNHTRYHAAQIRHQLAGARGEIHDPETGLRHLAHEACNALFRLELALIDAEEEEHHG